MLTISQLASYAGVTVRAVRHYHATGLLPEPGRDHSGYRRYDAGAVVQLIRIRTLAEAGVPLSRVSELLGADDEEFAAAVAQIDARLLAEIREAQEHRRRIALLAAGDSLALPEEAVAYLARLREAGVSERMVDAERDAWILVAAQLPERMPFFMAMKNQQLDDPRVAELYVELDEIVEWDPEDPRLHAVADRLVTELDAVPDAGWEDEGALPEDLAALLDAVFLDSVPGSRRILRRLEHHGWEGWTNLRRRR
ncbi:MerR family transcriptional regulator [Nocardioides marmoribigeumensis]|uniref:DNA-binding transcriptional MerR regulator n=1 Tax=Nocardioides marmoribigeumensis TaxID=433649 RepID=A0ABU2BPW0_9ACTN|nr:MerR family transcriptional regulator [Nocardioides marmoribigeumensis]MDR7360669.1 DNA-binding transcriptional MerR regulator [Nocardioides marmoribigeumensis]